MWYIILENIGGELDRWAVKKTKDVRSKFLEVIENLGSIEDGDVLRIEKMKRGKKK